MFLMFAVCIEIIPAQTVCVKSRGVAAKSLECRDLDALGSKEVSERMRVRVRG